MSHPARVITQDRGIYGCGSAMTAASQAVVVLALGWSVLEGLGAAMVRPRWLP